MPSNVTTNDNKVTPVKGMVWQHALRHTWDGKPKTLTITSVSAARNTVYSLDDLRMQVRTPLNMFHRYCLKVVSVPEPVQPTTSPTMDRTQCELLFSVAHDAGMLAGNNAVPVPMHVVQRANPFDDSSPIIKRYEPVMDGVCGFAWITVRPGNGSFARYLKDSKGCRKGYHGGVELWVRDFNQSLERKMAYARAFADVLIAAGVNAIPGSRMD